MKKLIIAIVFLVAALPTLANAHGGGCRKDSPAGQCCHMDHKTGIPHCH